MLNAKVIGLGAAGNKAVIDLIKSGAISAEKALLINTTDKDIPDGFKKNHSYTIIGDGSGGCGQERTKGKEFAMQALQSGTLNLDQFAEASDDVIDIITSTEGGSGSGSSVIVAKYLKEVLNQNVQIFAITGFEQSARGIWNTIEFFKDMKDSYRIEVIRNKKFMSDARGNQRKAEQLANTSIIERFNVLVGSVIRASEQNIDDRDLKKLSIEPGWGNTEFRRIDEKIKNPQQFNDIINDIIDETKSFDVSNPSQKRLGVIISLSEKEQDAVDYTFNEIINKYGSPYELYKHIQIAESDNDRFISFISSGMHLPIDELEALYNEAQSASKSVVTDADAFFDKIQEFGNNDSAFDLKDNNVTADKMLEAKNSFFAEFAKSQPQTPADQQAKATTNQSRSVRDMNNY